MLSFRRPVSKRSQHQVKPIKDLTRIVSADHFLADVKFSALVEQIREHCALDSQAFDSLGSTLIHMLVNYCQYLPDSSNSYYMELAGLIEHALNRTEIALALFKNYLIPDEQSNLSEIQKLWQYALFSAALLQGIGKLYLDYQVKIYKDNGEFLSPWTPLSTSLVEMGSYYEYVLTQENDRIFRSRLNSLFAKMLMPDSGFKWLTTNQHVLKTWLALLDEDAYASGTLGAILIHSNALAIQRYFNQQRLKAQNLRQDSYTGRVGTFSGGSAELTVDNERQAGIEFLQWLNVSLSTGKISINKAPLLMVPGGMIMSPDIFKLFVREHPAFKNWQAIQSGLQSLNLHQPLDNQLSAAHNDEHGVADKTGDSFVLSDYGVVLPQDKNIQLIHGNTGDIMHITGTSLIFNDKSQSYFAGNLAKNEFKSLGVLNAQGEWQQTNAAENIAPLLKHSIISHV